MNPGYSAAIRSVLSVLATGVVLAWPGPAARAAGAADWPCAQPLVTSLSTSAYWSAAPMPPRTDWRGDPRVSAVVTAAAPRDVPIDEAKARLSAFADSVPTADRPLVLSEVFEGLAATINEERTQLIARIETLAHRQRDLSRVVTSLAVELRDVPPGTPKAEDLIQRRDFATRAFQEAQRTMRYACEAPSALDGRLGQFARALQGRLGD